MIDSKSDLTDRKNYGVHYNFVSELKTRFERQVAIWCVHNIAALNGSQIEKKWVKVYYEELMVNPKETLTSIVESSGLPLSDQVIYNYNFSSPSKTNYNNKEFSDPLDLLDKSLNPFSKEQLERIQKIFNHFELKDYNAFSIHPVKKEYV